MRKKSDRSYDTKPKTLKRSTLAILLFAAFCFSMFLGVTAGALGLGSIYPQLNSIAQPVACPGHTMTHSQQVSEIGTTTYYAAKWFCVDDNGGRTEISSSTIALTAGPVYGIIFFAVLLALIYLYWNSKIGPAKNGGPTFW